MSASARELDTLLARLATLHPRIIDLSLTRIERLLAALGHPETKLPPVLHVAGTNGKGSTIAFARAALEAAGKRVHIYTSPHLVRFNERIVLAGRIIEDAPLIALLERTEAANAGAPMTFFEITTAAAFLAFAEAKADFLLLEVGLGGRLDATNVIARPAATCITPIDLDHRKYLGDTIEAIAAEKAGILKDGVAAVVSAQPAAALRVIAERVAAVGASMLLEERDWRMLPARGGGFVYEGPRWKLELPPPNLPGAHQFHNAATAIACLEQLDTTLAPAAIAKGIAGAQWPARLQRLTKGPLVALLPTEWELWLDGAHNPHGGAALAAWIEAKRRPVHLVTAMLDSKDPDGFFAALGGRIAAVRTVPVPGGHNGLDPEALARTAARAGHAAAPARDIADAIAALVAAAPPGPAILMIAGSLYLAGEVLAANG